MNRKFAFLLFLLSLVIGLVTNVKADHMVGSDIYWTCQGGDTFTITIVDYRDCNGIAFQNSPFVLTPVGNCPDVYSDTTVNGASSGGNDITPVCNRSCDRCPSDASCSFPYGIQQYFITATVVLPTGCCDYQISWTQCCRSAGITTGATWADYYITSQMSRCTFGYCDNSPYFTDPPVAIYCTNQCITYNPGANDIDRSPSSGAPDSLSYAFTPPLTASGSNTPWTGDYSYLKPLDYDGFPSSGGTWDPPQVCKGFHLDSTTGDIEFKAVKADVTVISLDVSEWRKDSLGVYVKIGEIRRDMQIIIVDCPADIPPIIPGINGGNSYSEQICADQQTCFNVLSFSLVPADTVKLSWNNPGTMNGATFTVVPDGKKWPTAVFCWFPTDKDVRSYPYTFVATAKDNACPIPGFNSRAFNIYVIAAPSAIYQATVGKCGLVTFEASPAPTSATAIVEYLWVGQGAAGYGPLYILGRTGSYKYTRGGTYYYTLVVKGPNGCTRTYSDSVTIANFPAISLPRDTAVCANSPTITVKATLLNAFQPYSVWWNFKGANGDSLTTGTITEKITHDTVFRVNILDEGCTNYDSMKVTVKPLPKPNLGPDQRGCWGHSIMLSSGLKPTPAVVKWTWILGADTIKNQYRGDTIFAVDSGMYVVSVQDSIGCACTDTANVFFNPLVRANRVDSTVCLNSTVTLRAGIGGSGASYLWVNQEHGNIVSTAPTFTFTASATSGGYGVQADLEIVIKQSQHGITCVDTGYYNIIVNTPSSPILSKIPPKCISDPAFQLLNTTPGVDQSHEGGTWVYPPNPAAVVDNFLYPSVMGETDNNALGYVHYIYFNAYKCVIDDSIKVTISKLPQVSAGPDTEICTGNGRYLLNNLYVTPTGGSWFPLNGTPSNAIVTSANKDSIFFDPNAVGITDTVYGVVYSYHDPESNGKESCSNNDTVYIKVRTNPVVTVGYIDSLCLNASPWPLQGTPQLGIWSFADATNKHALVNNTYFLADSAGPGWHYLNYTAYGDRSRSLCPTTQIDSVYVVPAPKNVNFSTSDNQWEYCVSHSPVSLIATVNGNITTSGEFTQNSYVYNTGSTYYFKPRGADTVNSNLVTYILPYNHNGCQVTVTHTVKVDGHPYVKITTAPSVCAGPTSFEIKATKSNATTLLWSSSGSNLGFSPLNSDSTDVMYSPTQTQLQSLNFQVTATASNAGDCPAYTATASFNINPVPVVDFSSNQSGCEPLAVHFAPTVSVGGISNSSLVKGYDWDFGDGSAHSQDINPYHVYSVTNGKDTQQFNVKLTVTSDSGCVGDTVKNSWITVYATPKPIITASPQFTTIALPQVQFTLDPRSSGIDYNDPATTYRWTFGDSSHTVSTLKDPQYTYGDTGAFKVKIEVRSKGCVGDTFITVYIQPELIIYIPNVFKPDNHHGDGKTGTHEPNYFSAEVNNTFQPVISSYQSFQMSIYNRWGQLMYTTTDPEKGWSGWFEGHEPVQDAYVYVIKATGYSGKPYTFTGTVTLLY